MNKTMSFKTLMIIIGALAVPAAGHADSLLEVYQQALQSDPRIHEAEARRLAALEAELAEIRRRNFAVSEGGTMPSINSVAAAVWHDRPLPFGSVVLTADRANMPAAAFDSFGATVAAMAEVLTPEQRQELLEMAERFHR